MAEGDLNEMRRVISQHPGGRNRGINHLGASNRRERLHATLPPLEHRDLGDAGRTHQLESAIVVLPDKIGLVCIRGHGDRDAETDALLQQIRVRIQLAHWLSQAGRRNLDRYARGGDDAGHLRVQHLDERTAGSEVKDLHEIRVGEDVDRSSTRKLAKRCEVRAPHIVGRTARPDGVP